MAICEQCGRERSRFDVGPGCLACRAEDRNKGPQEITPVQTEADRNRELDVALSRILLTTETSPNLPIVARLGIVTAECVFGLNIFKDIAAVFRDAVGGRVESMQKSFRDGREIALRELRMEADRLGADAVIAVDLTYSEITGTGKNMLFLVATGTAVKLKTD